MGTWVDFAEIRGKVSLEDVIVRLYGIETLRREGNVLIGPCPVHGGDSPRAFHADLDKNVWHCFSRCRRGGNQLDFVAAKDGISVRDAALKLQAAFLGPGEGMKKPPRAPEVPANGRQPAAPAARSRRATPERNDDADAEDNPPLDITLNLAIDHPHLTEERKLLPETIAHFGVGYCARGILRGMIAIPIKDATGTLVAYAGRRLRPPDIREFGKYKFPKGFHKDRVLFHLDRAKEHAAGGLILVEGFFSVMKLFEQGYPNVVAAMGCELSAAQVKLLATVPEVIILFDGDEAGIAGGLAARDALAGLTTVRLIRLPPGTKPDTVPPRVLRWLVNGARQLDLADISFAFRSGSPLKEPGTGTA